MANSTFFWHDYETFGANTRYDRPAQFAGIRTDLELNEVGEPVMLFCQPANDYVPDPQSCLITGITPQQCLTEGVPEHRFAERIEAELAQAGTIGVGYNTIRFDDEITRFMFWRNLMEPYAREWQHQCGRWDLLDVVRAFYAMRPEGIVWPKKEDGSPSFKLGDLAQANGIVHEAAHDALSDVRATIALARLLRQSNAKLFDFCLSLHKKDQVARELRLPTTAQTARPFLHVTGMINPQRGCIGVMWPLASHPTNKNELIAWDLAADPSELAHLSVETLRQRMFTRAADLPEGVTRLPIKTVHLNKSPIVVGNLKALPEDMAARWGLDMAQAMQHALIARDLPDMSALWAAVFTRPAADTPLDADQDLYGGFVGNNDRYRLNELRAMSPERLAQAKTGFDDPRLQELVWRYRARNFPHTLNEDEQERWEAHRAACLIEGAGGARTLEQLSAQIDALSEDADERAEDILGALYDYIDIVAP